MCQATQVLENRIDGTSRKVRGRQDTGRLCTTAQRSRSCSDSVSSNRPRPLGDAGTGRLAYWTSCAPDPLRSPWPRARSRCRPRAGLRWKPVPETKAVAASLHEIAREPRSVAVERLPWPRPRRGGGDRPGEKRNLGRHMTSDHCRRIRISAASLGPEVGRRGCAGRSCQRDALRRRADCRRYPATWRASVAACPGLRAWARSGRGQSRESRRRRGPCTG